MTGSRGTGTVSRGNRRWSFAGCSFDEVSWVLTVNDHRVPLESKPLELLKELLLRPGVAISKSELLDAVWPDVSVVEASLPTAIGKLRKALKDDQRECRIIETVPRIGYRLAVPVHVECVTPDIGADLSAKVRNERSSEFGRSSILEAPLAIRHRPSKRELAIGGSLAILFAVTAGLFIPSEYLRATQTAPASKSSVGFTQNEIKAAIRALDLRGTERLIAAGWDPSQPWDKEGNDALGVLLNRCEWDKGHDRRQMLMMARTLIEGGAPISRRNIWGDTAYSIAKSPRYCGPSHPVTQMLEAICYGSTLGPGDLCLATYELTSAQRQKQGLPPKA